MTGTRFAAAAALASCLLLIAWLALRRPSGDVPAPRASLAARPAGPLETPSAATQAGPQHAGAAPPTAPARSAVPGGVPRPRLLPRPAGEWQGMPVDLSFTPYCEESWQCGLARACREHACTGCGEDSHCSPGEACVLDHCVKATAVECRSAKDCRGIGPCALSGYSAGPRGNDDMQATCIDTHGGVAAPFSGAPALAPVPDTRPSLPGDELLRRAREGAGSPP